MLWPSASPFTISLLSKIYDVATVAISPKEKTINHAIPALDTNMHMCTHLYTQKHKYKYILTIIQHFFIKQYLEHSPNYKSFYGT